MEYVSAPEDGSSGTSFAHSPLSTMKMNLNTKLEGVFILATLIFCGCQQKSEMSPANPPTEGMMPPGGASITQAVATLSPTEGNKVMGTVTFSQEDNGVRVVADLTGLTEGEHGFHVHENGDCSAPDGSSAGGHFNPTGMPHGGPDSPEHHIGDLGNITADASGKAHLDHVFSFLSLNGTNSIVGHGLIVHGGKDDLTSQPSGAAGARVACGVIQKL